MMSDCNDDDGEFFKDGGMTIDNIMTMMNHGQMGHYHHFIRDLLNLPPGVKQGSCSYPTDRAAWSTRSVWSLPMVNHWSHG